MTGYVLIAVPIYLVVIENLKEQIQIHKLKVNNLVWIFFFDGGITFLRVYLSETQLRHYGKVI